MNATIDQPDQHYIFNHINMRLKQLQENFHSLDKKVDLQGNEFLHICKQLTGITETLDKLKSAYLESMGESKTKKKILNSFYMIIGVLGTLGLFDFIFRLIEKHLG